MNAVSIELLGPPSTPIFSRERKEFTIWSKGAIRGMRFALDYWPLTRMCARPFKLEMRN